MCRLLFGGSIPHYFFQCLEWLIPGSSKMAVVKQLLFQRLIFTPIYQLFTLYTISRLEVCKYYQNFVYNCIQHQTHTISFFLHDRDAVTVNQFISSYQFLCQCSLQIGSGLLPSQLSISLWCPLL